MHQKRKLILPFAAVGLIFTGLVLNDVPAQAQSYPGLSTTTSKERNTAPRKSREEEDRPGYRGLVTGNTAERRAKTPRAASRPERPATKAPAKPQAHNPEKYYGQSRVDLPKEPKVKQSLPEDRSPDKPVKTEEDLRLASVLAQSHPDNISLGESVKFSDKTKKALNQPREIKGGMYPKERNMMNYINSNMRKINKMPRADQQAAVTELRKSLNILMDANYSKLSLPDKIFSQMGMTPEAIAESRKEDKAVNARMEQVLEQLK